MSEDLTEKLPASDREKLNLILTIVQNLSSTVQNLSSSVQNLSSEVADIKLRLTNLEQKVEERLYDTRPIWEKLAADILQLKEETRELRNLLIEETREIKTHLRDIYRRLSIFNDTLVTIQVDYRDIYDRVRRLELGPG
jgi:hypothetical protein